MGFASIFLIILIGLGLPDPESEDHKCGNSDLPSVGTEILRDQLCKAMEPDGILPGVLKELLDAMTRALPIIYQRSWEPGEDPANWK